MLFPTVRLFSIAALLLLSVFNSVIHGFEIPVTSKTRTISKPATALNVLYAPIKTSPTRAKSSWYSEYNPTARIVKYDDEPSYDEMSFLWRITYEDNIANEQESPQPTRLQKARRRMAAFLFRNRRIDV